MPKILIIAGEPSGDNLGAQLIQEMIFQHSLISSTNKGKEVEFSQKFIKEKEIIFQGIGGPLMKKQGLISLFSMEDLSVMGLTEIIPRLPKIFSIIRRLVEYVNIWKPDLIITVDSPDFSIRLVKRLRMVDKFVPIIHYVAPSVWAWRPLRAKEMAKYYDHILALLPFETCFFEKFGISCEFVGHPVSRQKLPNKNQVNDFISAMNLDISKRIITVLPGSRKKEIYDMLPIFISMIKKLRQNFDDLEFVIPTPMNVAKLVKSEIIKAKIDVKILTEDGILSEEFKLFKLSLFYSSTIAVATSGSVALELARSSTPMIAAYRSGWLFEKILKRFVKLDSANLINIILKKSVIPEFLFEKCNSKNICASVIELLNDSDLRLRQKEAEREVINILIGTQKRPSETAAKSVLSFIT